MSFEQKLKSKIEQNAKSRAIQIDKKYGINQISIFENANRSYAKGANLLAPLLVEARAELNQIKNICESGSGSESEALSWIYKSSEKILNRLEKFTEE